MPPKRKAAAAKGGPAAKKGKKAVAVAEDEVPETMKDKITKLKAADEGKVKKHKPDSYCHVADSVSSGYKFCKSTDVQIYEFNNSVFLTQGHLWSETPISYKYQEKKVSK